MSPPLNIQLDKPLPCRRHCLHHYGIHQKNQLNVYKVFLSIAISVPKFFDWESSYWQVCVHWTFNNGLSQANLANIVFSLETQSQLLNFYLTNFKIAIKILISLIRTVGWNSNSNTGSQVNSREAKSSDSFSAVSCFTTKQTRGTRPLYKPIGFNLDKSFSFCMFQSCPYTYMRKHRLWRIFVTKRKQQIELI